MFLSVVERVVKCCVQGRLCLCSVLTWKCTYYNCNLNMYLIWSYLQHMWYKSELNLVTFIYSTFIRALSCCTTKTALEDIWNLSSYFTFHVDLNLEAWGKYEARVWTLDSFTDPINESFLFELYYTL